jgi:lipoprotein-anchoring transpeptidase ErfK/SrfK
VRLRAAAAGAGIVVVAALAGLVASSALFGGGDGGRPAVPLPDAPGGSTRFTPDAALARLPRGTNVVATPQGTSVRVFGRAGGGHARTLRRRTVEGHRIPLVFLVKRRRGAWLQAYLPTRPKLSTGWLRAADVRLATTRYRVEVGLRRHRMTLWRGGRAVLRAPIAKGRAVSPTPTGRYYVTDLLRPHDPHGFYGPYALGLSAHSPVFTSFAGGDGQVGLHGTNQPSALGHDVSHGCIRVANRVITRVAELVPLGTPVDITRD